MHTLTVTARGTSFPAALVSIVPYGDARLAITVTLPFKLDRGESCHLHNAFGRQLDCVVASSEPLESGFSTELRCVADAAFQNAPEEEMQSEDVATGIGPAAG